MTDDEIAADGEFAVGELRMLKVRGDLTIEIRSRGALTSQRPSNALYAAIKTLPSMPSPGVTISPKVPLQHRGPD